MPVEIVFIIFILIVTALATAGVFYEKNKDKKKNTHN